MPVAVTALYAAILGLVLIALSARGCAARPISASATRAPTS